VTTKQAVLGLAMIAASALPGAAQDVVSLCSGQAVEGVIMDTTGATVVIESNHSTLTISKAMVSCVEISDSQEFAASNRIYRSSSEDQQAREAQRIRDARLAAAVDWRREQQAHAIKTRAACGVICGTLGLGVAGTLVFVIARAVALNRIQRVTENAL